MSSKRKRSFTTELLTQQQGEILKVGFLRKKGHIRRNWLDRWFVLTTEGLYYYKNRLVSNCCTQRRIHSCGSCRYRVVSGYSNLVSIFLHIKFVASYSYKT